MKITRLYSGDDGESHFEDTDIPLEDGGEIGRLSKLVKTNEKTCVSNILREGLRTIFFWNFEQLFGKFVDTHGCLTSFPIEKSVEQLCFSSCN